MTAWRSAVVGAALVLLGACAHAPARALPSPTAIDAEVARLMAREDVKGMAVAVINRGEVVHVGAYGLANVAEQRPLRTDTVMYGASLTKAAFAYFVMQLVDEGRFDLDRPLASYLPRPLPEYEDYADLASDERWRALTARHVLNHTTGFANFRWLEDDQRLRFHSDPGSRYGYSGEGFYILQLTLEEGLGLDVGAEMQRRVFDRFGMTRTSMQWRADFRPNLADGYGEDGSFEPHDERSSVSAAGSMDTTIADQARLWAGIVRGEGLSAGSREELTRAQFPILSAHQFPTLVPGGDPRGPAIGLSAGVGVVTFNDASGPIFFKGGHNDWTGNMVICQEARQRCVVFLANSVRAEHIYPELAAFILGETTMPWWWEYNR
ncbi:MAG: serine hydrolase domain-containing protein [Hyphomonadaceae bacterium]